MRIGPTLFKSRLLLLGAALPFVTGAAGVDAGFSTRILAAHNNERAAMGVPPLGWDADLANGAQQWANNLASSGRFAHSPQTGRGDIGENLWMGTKGYYVPENMVGAWVREKKFFKSGRFPNNSTTGNVSDVGHYTQLVWRETGSVGCAKAANAQAEFLVCRYSDAGNYIGESPL